MPTSYDDSANFFAVHPQVTRYQVYIGLSESYRKLSYTLSTLVTDCFDWEAGQCKVPTDVISEALWVMEQQLNELHLLILDLFSDRR